MATVTTAQIQEIYIGYLGRAADKAGLDYWVAEITSDNLTLEQLRANITNEQAEYTSGYGQLSRDALVDAVYESLFEHAPDAAGKEYWVTGGGKDINADQLILAVMNGASTDDKAVLTNKTTVAEYYTAITGDKYDAATAKSTIDSVDGTTASVDTAKTALDTTFLQDRTFTIAANTASVTEGQEVTFTVTMDAAATVDTVLNYQIAGIEVAGGTADPAADLGKVTGEVTIAAGQSTGTFILTPSDDGVTEGFEGFNVALLNSSFVTVATSSNVVIKDGAAAGQTFTLTTTTDTFTGTSGNDTLNGVLQGAGASGTTVQPGDSFDGGDGIDTLSISVAGDSNTVEGAGQLDGAGYTLSAISTNNVEKVLLSNFDTDTNDANTVDTALMTGMTTVGLSASSASGDTTFSGLKNLVNAEMNNGAADLTLDFNASVVTGTTDAIDLTVSNTTAGTFTAAGVETVNVKTGLVDSTLTELTVADATVVNVSGTTDLTVTNGLATKTIDASTLTGDLTLTLGNQNQTVTAGTGNDTIDAATFLTKADTLVGGEGTDTLKMSVGNSTIDATASTGELINVSGFEVMQVNSTNDAATLDLNGVTGVTAVEAAANTYSLAIAGTNESVDDTVSFTLNGTTYTTDKMVLTSADATKDSVEEMVAAKINSLDGFTAVAAADSVTITATSGEAVELSGITYNDAGTTNAVGGGAAATGSLSAVGTTGLTNVTFANLAADTAVNVYSADKVTANLKDASGDADALTVNLATVAADKGFDHTVGEFETANIETLNLNSAGLTDGKKNTLETLSADSKLTTLNVTGDSDLDLTGTLTASKLATVNAGTFTGDLSIDGISTLDQTITTGAGNDTIVMAGNLTAADVIDGGANTALADGTDGKDKVTVTGAVGTVSVAAALQITNVEDVEFANGAADANLDATAITGASSLAFSQDSGQSTKVVNLAAGTEIGMGIGDVEFEGTLDVALADASGTADSITLNYADAINAGTTTVLKVADTVETLNISATKDTDSNDTTQTITSTNMKATNVVITDGDAGSTLALGTLASNTTNVDASAHKGALTMVGATGVAMTVSANGAVANTITTSTGNDTVTLSGKLGTSIQDISANTGTDVLNATADNAATDFTGVDGFETINLTVESGASAGFDDAAKDNGLNGASTINILGGNSLSNFTVGGTATIDDAGTAQTVDASGFNGTVNLILASDAFDAELTLKGGASTTDLVQVAIADTDNKVAEMSGIETLIVQSTDNDTDADIDLTNVTGLVTLEAQFVTATNEDQIEVKQLASGVKVKTTVTETGDQLVIDLKDKANADNVLDLELTSFATTADDVLDLNATGVETLNLTNKSTNAGVVDLAGVDGTGTASVNVTVAGTGATTLNALNTDIVSVDASTATGGLTIAAAQRDTDVLTVKGGFGNDTIAMENKADVLDGAAGTDMLTVNYNAILGGIEVDLSAADQITNMDGGVNAAVQNNFENVDLSGYTGFGAVVVGSTAANAITGTGSADNLKGGEGADIITGGAGADVINLTESTAAVDTAKYTAATDSTLSAGVIAAIAADTVGHAADAIALMDKISGFSSDKIDLAGVVSGTATIGGAAVAAAAGTSDANFKAALNTAAAGNGGTNSVLNMFSFDGNQYLVVDNGAGATFAEGDMVIQLTGTNIAAADGVVAGLFTL